MWRSCHAIGAFPRASLPLGQQRAKGFRTARHMSFFRRNSRVELPESSLIPDPFAGSSAVTPQPPRTGHRMKILTVDDDLSFSELIRRSLGSAMPMTS